MEDIFELAPFNLQTMAATVVKRPFKPNQLSKAFSSTIVRSPTTDVRINIDQGRVKVLPSTPRGAPAPQRFLDKRRATKVEIPGYAEGFTCSYVEAMNVAGGLTGAAQLMAAETLVNQYLAASNDDMDVTWEHQIATAIRGLVIDSDGVELVDLYDVMKVEQTEFDIDLTKPLAPQFEKLKLLIARLLRGENATSFKVITGSEISQWLSENDDYRKMATNPLHQFRTQADLSTGNKGFQGNVDFEHYHRGFFAPDEAYIVPVYDGHMQTVYGPAGFKDYLGVVLDRYVTRHELPHGKGIEVELWSFFLNMFTRPEANIKLNFTK